MATGVPKKRYRANNNGHNVRGVASEIVLQYPNKRSAGEILQTAPANTVLCAAGAASEDLRISNRLYFGDNLPILATLLKEPTIAGHVRLVYIDPPFATETVFHSRQLKHAYEDTLTGSEYLEFLRQRLVFLKELLAEDGSIYIHLDAKMVFHVKVIMDELFGSANFRNCITRKKCNPKNYTRKQYGNVGDFILFYTKSATYIWNKPIEPWTEERSKEYQYVDSATGRRFMKVPVHAPGIRRGETGRPWRGMLPPPGKHWQFLPSVLDEMDARGEIYWSAHGNPRRKIFLDNSPGIPVQDIWLDFRDAHNQNIHITGYPTEKNPDLLARIIGASSNPGDLVLDCFSGSGTTLALADRLGRRWVGVENSIEAIKTTLKRFAHGLEPMGDFVSQRNNIEKKAMRSSPTLFSCLEDADRPSCEPQRDKPITHFVLIAEKSLHSSAAALISGYRLCPGAGGTHVEA